MSNSPISNDALNCRLSGREKEAQAKTCRAHQITCPRLLGINEIYAKFFFQQLMTNDYCSKNVKQLTFLSRLGGLLSQCNRTMALLGRASGALKCS